MRNKAVRELSKCANCVAKNPRFLKQSLIKRLVET